MLTWLILQHYSAGKVLDLSFHLPGAGAVFPRENLSAVDLSSFLYGLGYCLGWQRDSEEARLVPLLTPAVPSGVLGGPSVAGPSLPEPP